jgi:hypothetical protein
LRKFISVAKYWGSTGVGQQYSVAAYTCYVLPILSFVGQLSKPPDAALQAEAHAFRLMFPGPGNWCTQADLHYMSSFFGQSKDLPSLAHMCSAAQKRVFVWEDLRQGGLKINSKFKELAAAKRNTEFFGRLARWHGWYDNGATAVLFHNSQHLADCGLDSEHLLRLAGWDNIPSDRVRGIRRVKSKYQRCVRQALDHRLRPNYEERIRNKLARWKFNCPARILAQRTSRMLMTLRKLVPPRVSAAVWRTLWNGWTTGRRFQRRDCKCLLRCGSAYGADSIEHYAGCMTTISVGAAFAGLSTERNNCLDNFVTLGLNKHTVPDTTLVKRAVLVYAIYRTTNTLRHSPTDDADVIHDMIRQYMREGVRGHPDATLRLEMFDPIARR